MIELQKAIAAAGLELIEAGWQLDSDENKDVAETEFYRILFRHLEPLFEDGALRAARIAALRAELEMLESG